MAALEMAEVSKSFHYNKVLNRVWFDLNPGEVHALIGENGAGKSTLMKILMGVYQADMGEIRIDGTCVNINSPAKALALGVAMIHQELFPILDMTLAENIFIGREIRRMGIVDKKEQERRSRDILSMLGLTLSPSKLMRELTVSEMQMVEIAKTISSGARFIIMDEPTSAITEAEVGKLFQVIRQLCAKGIGIVYISHKMNELFTIAERITVLRDGNYIGTRLTKETNKDEIIRMMVGREITEVFPQDSHTPGDVILSVRNLSRVGEFKDISFDLRRGERLGIAGLMGAGRTELVMSLFGERRLDSGEIFLNGKPVKIKSPKQAIRYRIALITEDRKKYGLNLLWSTRDNILSIIENRFSTFGWFHDRKADAVARDLISTFNIKVNSPKHLVSFLSGGNQQKVVLAKWLARDNDVFIFDEPTRGIDVGAKAEIYKIINSLCAQGKAIIIISSELPELIGLSDRMIVMHAGKLNGELSGDELTQEKIIQYASGV